MPVCAAACCCISCRYSLLWERMWRNSSRAVSVPGAITVPFPSCAGGMGTSICCSVCTSPVQSSRVEARVYTGFSCGSSAVSFLMRETWFNPVLSWAASRGLILPAAALEISRSISPTWESSLRSLPASSHCSSRDDTTLWRSSMAVLSRRGMTSHCRSNLAPMGVLVLSMTSIRLAPFWLFSGRGKSSRLRILYLSSHICCSLSMRCMVHRWP